MISLIVGSLVLSVLHALIPNHWLPILAIARKENWTVAQTMRITLLVGLAHATSTVLVGLLLALLGAQLAVHLEQVTRIAGPVLLAALGVYYIYQHSRHHHFHLHGHPEKSPHNKMVWSLTLAMFLSPCFEIEPYFLLAGAQDLWLAGLLAALYTLVTVFGMVLWVRATYKTLLRFNWHTLEHNAGIITGATLILSGILMYFIQ